MRGAILSKTFRLLCCLLGWALPAAAHGQNSVIAEPVLDTETDWKGLHFQLVKVERIMAGRLMVEIRVIATAQTPLEGTALAFPGSPLPPGIKKRPWDLYSGRYNARPFSLAKAVMTDELSGVSYPALPAVAPPGKAYYSDSISRTFRPHDFQEMSIQFIAPPPPPPPPPGQPPRQQTLTFSLPTAKASLSHIPMPTSK